MAAVVDEDESQKLLLEHRTVPEVEQLLVEGAGTKEVNGSYTLIEVHERRGLYRKKVSWQGNQSTLLFHLSKRR